MELSKQASKADCYPEWFRGAGNGVAGAIAGFRRNSKTVSGEQFCRELQKIAGLDKDGLLACFIWRIIDDHRQPAVPGSGRKIILELIDNDNHGGAARNTSLRNVTVELSIRSLKNRLGWPKKAKTPLPRGFLLAGAGGGGTKIPGLSRGFFVF